MGALWGELAEYCVCELDPLHSDRALPRTPSKLLGSPRTLCSHALAVRYCTFRLVGQVSVLANTRQQFARFFLVSDLSLIFTAFALCLLCVCSVFALCLLCVCSV